MKDIVVREIVYLVAFEDSHAAFLAHHLRSPISPSSPSERPGTPLTGKLRYAASTLQTLQSTLSQPLCTRNVCTGMLHKATRRTPVNKEYVLPCPGLVGLGYHRRST